MKINIHGDKIKVTESIRDYVEQKLSKLEKYFNNASEINMGVILRVRNNEQIIEVTAKMPKFTIRAEEHHEDLYAAIDLVVDKLERQIRKNKTRLTRRFHKEARQPEFNFDFEEDTENEDKIVRRKNVDSKPMDEEEAILQMELLNHDFFIFNNIDEECVSVLYRRKDGQYGIINTK